MKERIRHMDHGEALRLLDGEMSLADAAHWRTHLQGCDACAALLAETESTSNAVKGVVYEHAEPVWGQEQANERLRLRLQETSETVKPQRAGLLVPRVRYAFAACAVLVVLLGVTAHYRSQSVLAALPNKNLTPGATRAVELAELCTAGDDEDLDPSVSASVQTAVFHEYGIANAAREKDFQVDYLINPQLGGTNDIHNLWPQPYQSTVWNARAKDALERHLHQMVCERKVDLAEAQREIATNWIAAYQKYFHTANPA